MNEEQSIYIAKNEEEEDELHEIRDEAPHNYFTCIPNLIDDLNLNPYAFRLYSHLKRVAGEMGACWQSTSTLAKICNMSLGMVSKSKHDLQETNPPLIRVERKHKENGDWYHEIKITDIWMTNSRAFSPHEGAFSYSELPFSCSENGSSPHETKKNHVKKNQILNGEKQNFSRKLELPDGSGMDWLIAAGADSSALAEVAEKERHEKTISDLWEIGMGYNPLPWHTDKDLKILLRFLLDKSPDDIKAFCKWVRRPFTSFGPEKAREKPQRVIELWPQAFVKLEDNSKEHLL